MMKFTLVGAALALALGTAYAADSDKDKGMIQKQEEKGGALNNESSFRVMDKNHDGYLSRSEVAGDKELSRRFKEADTNNDGKLSRFEYFKIMAKIDTHNAANKVSKSTEPKSKTSASGGTTSK